MDMVRPNPAEVKPGPAPARRRRPRSAAAVAVNYRSPADWPAWTDRPLGHVLAALDLAAPRKIGGAR